MTRMERIRMVAAPIALALGVTLAALPHNWIETWLRIDADGGSGALESVFAMAPVSIGLALALGAWGFTRLALAHSLIS